MPALQVSTEAGLATHSVTSADLKRSRPPTKTEPRGERWACLGGHAGPCAPSLLTLAHGRTVRCTACLC